MKRILLILFVLCSTLKAQIYLDTLVSRYVGPGTIYTKIKAPSVPWDIDVLRVDLKNPYIKVETIKASDKLSAREQTSSMAKRKSTEGHYALGAVNGDFYDLSTGIPINTQVQGGQILRTPISLSTIGFSPDNKPMLSIVSYSGQVITKNASNKIHNVNMTRSTDQLVIYNSFKGASTGTNIYGAEALVNPLKAWVINDTIPCVVEKIETGVGNMAIPAGKAVLSGNGTSSAFITGNIKAGDTIKVYQGLNPGLKKIQELIGGYPRIVNNGQNAAEEGFRIEGGPDHAHNREPRTAAGFSADSTYLYLITLDGRGSSVGATLPELADVMLKVGVAYGINFDGGGSTTMVVRNTIMNTVSDGVERADANCLAVFSSAPSSTDSLKTVAFGVRNKRIYKGDKFQLSLYGNDRYGNPVTLNTAAIKYSADPAIGSVDANGLFTSNGKPGQGYVYAELNGAKDSAYIYVKRIGRLDLTPKSTVVDANKSLAFNLKAYDPDNVQRTYITSEVQWKSSNPNVAVVDSLGNVIGKSEGTAKIIATIYGVVSDTATVTVQIGKGTTIMNGMEKLEDFSITGLNIDLNATKASLSTDKTEGTSSIKIDYKYTYDNTKSFGVFLDTKLPIYGIPDSLWIDTKTTDTLSQSRLYFILSDDNNELFRISAFGYINSLDKFTSIPVPMRSFAALGSGVFYYPAIITRFEIALQKSGRVNGQVYTGTIYLDNLRAKYPNSSTSVEAENGKLPESYYLGQNYPNPFNPSTVIEFSLPDNNQEVSLKVYDLLGREVAELVNGKMSAGQHKVLWNASQNASGVYFYRLQSGNYAETKKMMFIR